LSRSITSKGAGSRRKTKNTQYRITLVKGSRKKSKERRVVTRKEEKDSTQKPTWRDKLPSNHDKIQS